MCVVEVVIVVGGKLEMLVFSNYVDDQCFVVFFENLCVDGDFQCYVCVFGVCVVVVYVVDVGVVFEMLLIVEIDQCVQVVGGFYLYIVVVFVVIVIGVVEFDKFFVVERYCVCVVVI